MPRHNRFPKSFAFRLEEDVAAKLRDVADAHGYAPAEWARKIVSEAVAVDFVRRSVRLRILHADLLRDYLVELQRQGNNVNQIARALNIGQSSATRTALVDLAAVRQQQQSLMIAVLDALGADTTP